MRRRFIQNQSNGGIDVNNYLTIEALQDDLTVALSVNACEYCVDGDGNWKDLPAGTTTQSIKYGQTLSFRGNLTPDSSNGIGTLTVNKIFRLKGNAMSMLFGDDAVNTYSLSGKDYAFYALFQNCTTLKSVSINFLPATTLSSYCYSYMFYGCSSLVTSPDLPATTLDSNCYSYMFYGCRSLVTSPDLPATTLASYCYNSMFYSCSNLTTAPVLPATTLADNCYSYMFQDCEALTTAPDLPATTLAVRCYYRMFYMCTKLTTAPDLPATTLSSYCYGYMFDSCVSLITAPELPATTLSSGCYEYMFRDCFRLTTAPDLPATTLAVYCYYYMFYGCRNLTTAPELPATTLAMYCYCNMFRNCTNLNYIKATFTTTPSVNYTGNWVDGVASSGTFVKNKNASWSVTGVNGIPSGWTVVDDGEESGESILTFPVTLVEGDNGEIGISVYQYMLDKGTSEVQLSDKEVIYITHNNKTEIASWFMYCDGSLGYIEAPLQEGYYVILHENGHVDTCN